MQALAQARVYRGRQSEEVLFSLAELGFGGQAVAVSALRRLSDGFEVALERAGARSRDQAAARAAAGDQHGRRHAYGAGGEELDGPGKGSLGVVGNAH